MATPQEAFDKHFDVTTYPSPVGQIALLDGVHNDAVSLIETNGMRALDLRRTDTAEALRELHYNRVDAVLGRGELDKALRRAVEANSGVFWEQRESGVLVDVRLGNGVEMDCQRAFDDGVVVERTPGGNAGAVRIWQDLGLLAALDPSEAARQNNPAWGDDQEVKLRGNTAKLAWDRKSVNQAVNPHDSAEELETGRSVNEARRLLNGKKVAVIGAGRIGQEVIRHSPLLREADVHVYDPYPPEGLTGVTIADTLASALDQADVVMLHLAGSEEVLGAEQLAMLKKGAVVCNMARGRCVNPQALYEALQSGQVGKAVLDTHVVEGKDLLPYQSDLAHDSGSCNDAGHYAVRLRQHPNVIATNHSAASETQSQAINANEGVTNAVRLIRRGEIREGIVAPSTDFPCDAFLREIRDGQYVPGNNPPGRFVMEVMHDGKRDGLLTRMREMAADVLGQGQLNLVTGSLKAREFNGTRNGVALDVCDLPDEIAGQAGRKLYGEIMRAAERVDGIRRVRIHVPRLRSVA